MKTQILRSFLLATCAILMPVLTWAQPEMKLKLNEDGSQYIKATFLNQIWLRYNQSNPGTLQSGGPADQTFDIGLRRTRAVLMGQITDRMFVYTQFGMNNFNYASNINGNRKLQAFFHDAMGEYKVFKDNNKLKIGGGLTICNGLSRFSQPSIGTIMTMDVPIFAQATVDQTDEFSRKLSVFARGQIKRLDYRLILSDPFPVATSGLVAPLGPDATFATIGHHQQAQGLLIWNFFESEAHTTPYMTGTYLGKKKVLNLEVGAIYQPKATWYTSGSDTAYSNMLHYSVAAFLDMPVNKERMDAVSAYVGYFKMDYGPNYVRNNAPMNPGNGLNATQASFNGTGTAYPMFGTGTTIYAQAGYKFKEGLLGKLGTLLPYASTQYGKFDKLKDPVVTTDLGVNWLMQGHTQKLSLAWQQRPIFNSNSAGDLVASTRKNAVIMQYQTSF